VKAISGPAKDEPNGRRAPWRLSAASAPLLTHPSAQKSPYAATPPLHTSQGLYVDEEDNVLGGPTANLAIITQDYNFVYAPFDRAPTGITVNTLAELIPEVGRGFVCLCARLCMCVNVHTCCGGGLSGMMSHNVLSPSFT
jgi:hypothetical protein